MQGFFESLAFRSWRDDKHSARLWVRGAPGQGKSVLAKAAIHHLEQFSKSTSVVGNIKVLYFFFYSQEKEFSTPQSLVRAFIVQLLTSPQMFEHLPGIYQTRPEDFMTERFETLWDIFQRLVRDPCLKRIYCVIDALDECENRTSNLLPAIKSLFREPTGNPRRLNLIITSRPVPDLASELESFPYIDLKATTEDLQLFIKRRISSLPNTFTPALQAKTTELLLEQTERTFLWSSIVIKKLERMMFPSPANVRAAVEASSTDLDELYHDIISQILQGPSEGQKLLMWVAYGRRALTLKELESALATQIDSKSQESTEDYRASVTEQAVASTAGIILEISVDTVHLIHQSAKDFIHKSHQLDKAVFLAELGPDVYLAKICMTYLNFDDFHKGPCNSRQLLAERNRTYALLDYASRKWHTHIKSSDDIKEVYQLLQQLVEPRSFKLLAWGEAAGIKGLDTANDTFDIATKAGIIWLAGVTLKGEIITRNHVTAAVQNLGKGYELLETLLREGTAVITDEAKETIAGTGSEKIVRLLLDMYADTTVSNQMLLAAAANSKSGREVMRLFLNRRDYVEIAADFVMAANSNHVSGVEILGLVFSSDKCRITEDATEAVVQHFSLNVIEILLSEMDALKLTSTLVAGIAGKAKLGKLFRESGEATEAVLEQFLRKDTVEITEGAAIEIALRFSPKMIELLWCREDVCISDQALIEYARRGNVRLFQAALDRKPDIRVTEALVEAAVLNTSTLDAKGILMLLRRRSELQITEPVLKAAASRRNTEIIELLLNTEDVQITGVVLEAAASNTYCGQELLDFLLNRSNIQVTEAVIKAAAGNRSGVEMMFSLSAKDNFRVTSSILEVAAQHERADEMMFILLKRNDVQITETVVKAAYSHNTQKYYVLGSLLDKGGKNLFEQLARLIDMRLEKTQYELGQLLIAAAARGYEEVIRMLLENHANVRAKEAKSQKTALHYATLRRDDQLVGVLLKYGADINAKDKDGKTALHHAAVSISTYPSTLELLLSKGADMSARDEIGMTVLHCAAQVGNEIAIVVLRKQGADLQAKDKYQRTALHYAAEEGYIDLFTLLLDQANLHAKDIEQKTALNLAAFNGHTEVTRYIGVLTLGDQTLTWLPPTADELDNEFRPISREALEDNEFRSISFMMPKDVAMKVEAPQLHIAVYVGAEARMRWLLEGGARVDISYDYGTPLHWAACGGHEGIVRILLNMGLDINAQDVLGTPLLWAAQSGHEKVVQYLLEQGAKVEATDFQGKSALHLAAKKHPDVELLLLKYDKGGRRAMLRKERGAPGSVEG